MQPFVRRWCVTGRTADGTPCTTLFDLTTQRSLIVYPAAVGTYVVTLDAAGVAMAQAAVDAGEDCALRSRRGARTLQLRTLSGQTPAIELSVDDGSTLVSIRYTGAARTELGRALADAARELERRPS